MAAGTPESRSRMPVDGDTPTRASLSPASSAESNFRELDDAFLQTQTRIWLGEVLQIRFDEQANISDLLADGEILFEVSEVISRMLPTLAVDATHQKLNEWKSVASSKSTWRYMPYYNVGSFLWVCKNLGLDSIDLFTPSDVVEKRNTRKVCICIRSLSKKVRSRDLNVPDFDSVTCTITMPTDMVQYIRQSLERSQSSSSLSVEQDSEKVRRIRYCRTMSNSASPVSNSYSDNCDVADSISMVSGSHGSSNHTSDAASPTIVGPESRFDEASLKLQLNMDLGDEEDAEGEYLSPVESVGSPHSEYYSDQELSSVQSSSCRSSCIDGKCLEVDSMEKHVYQNVDADHVPIDLGDSSWDFRNYRDDSAINEEIDDAHDREDSRKNGFNACSLLHNIHMENSAHPSEIECENNSCDDTKPICCMSSTTVVDGESNVPYECAVEDDLCAGEAPISESESFEDELVSSRNDVDKSYSCDLCVIEDDNALIHDGGKSHSEEMGNANDLSSESPTDSAEVMHAGENSGRDSLDHVETTLENGVDEVKLHPEQCLCTFDSSAESIYCPCPEAVKSNASENDWLSPKYATESCTAFHLLPDIDTIISGNIHESPTKNEKEAVDTELNTLDHTERCCADNSMPIVDLGSFPSMTVTKDSEKCPDMVCQDTQQGYEDVNVMNESIESRPITTAGTQEESEDHNVRGPPSDSVIIYDNSINMEDATCVNSYTTTLANPQLGTDSPRTEDAVIKHNVCVETVEKGELENVEGEDNNKEIQLHKPQRKLLKSVVKGTALVGIAVFLLQLRKNVMPSLLKDKQQPVEASTRKADAKPSSEKVQKAGGGNTSSVYPAEKLRLGT